MKKALPAPVILDGNGDRLADAPKDEPKPLRMTSPLDLAETIHGNLHAVDLEDYEFPAAVLCFSVDGDENEYPYSIIIRAPNRLTMDFHVNAAIAAGQVPILHDGVKLHLHAVQGHRFVMHDPALNKYMVNLTYIFRVRPIRETKEA